MTKVWYDAEGLRETQTSFSEAACNALHKQWNNEELTPRDEELLIEHKQWLEKAAS